MNLSSPTPSPAPQANAGAPAGCPRPPVTSDVQRLGADFERQLQERSLARRDESSTGRTDSPRGGDESSSLPRSETSVSYAVRGSYDQGGSQDDTGSGSHTTMFRQMFGDAPPTTLSARSLGDTMPSPAPSLARMLGEPAAPQQSLTTLSAQNPAAETGNPATLAGEPAPKPLKGETAKKPLSDAKQAGLCRDTLGGAQSLRGPAAGSGQGTQSSQSAGGRSALARLTSGGQTEDPQAEALAAMLEQQAPRGRAPVQAGGSDEPLQQVGALARQGGRGKGGIGHDDSADRGELVGDAFGNTQNLQAAPNSPPPTAAGMLPAEASKTQAALETALRHSMPTSELGKTGTWEVSIPQAAGGTLELKATRAQPVTGNDMTAGWNLDIRTSRLDAEAFARQQSRLAERLQSRRVVSHIRIEGNDGESTEDGGEGR